MKLTTVRLGLRTKVLVAYATRCGATAGMSEGIAKVLCEEGSYVRVANLKEEKIKDISDYDPVVMGSGIQMFRRTGEAEEVPQRNSQQENGGFPIVIKKILERKDKEDELAKACKDDLKKRQRSTGCTQSPWLCSAASSTTTKWAS